MKQPAKNSGRNAVLAGRFSRTQVPVVSVYRDHHARSFAMSLPARQLRQTRAMQRPSVRWRPAGPVCAANPLPERWGARRFYRGQKRRIDFRHPSELGHALGNRDETIQTSVIPCGTRLLRRPVWPECRHISANNMHALDASLYLAISIIDAVGVRRETVFE
jgi:hypothetical protein